MKYILLLILLLSGCDIKSETEIAKEAGYTYIIKTGVETQNEWSKTIFAKNITKDGSCVEGDMITKDRITEYNTVGTHTRVCKYEMLYRL